jgi:hypothetical protein
MVHDHVNMSDQELLEAVLEKEDLDDRAHLAFEEMYRKTASGLWVGALTKKQRAWAEAVLEGRRYEPTPEYENLVSSGKVPRGNEVPTPLALQNLPKKPPGRK